jgi:hypothetical protein
MFRLQNIAIIRLDAEQKELVHSFVVRDLKTLEMCCYMQLDNVGDQLWGEKFCTELAKLCFTRV